MCSPGRQPGSETPATSIPAPTGRDVRTCRPSKDLEDGPTAPGFAPQTAPMTSLRDCSFLFSGIFKIVM